MSIYLSLILLIHLRLEHFNLFFIWYWITLFPTGPTFSYFGFSFKKWPFNSECDIFGSIPLRYLNLYLWYQKCTALNFLLKIRNSKALRQLLAKVYDAIAWNSWFFSVSHTQASSSSSNTFICILLSLQKKLWNVRRVLRLPSSKYVHRSKRKST